MVAQASLKGAQSFQTRVLACGRPETGDVNSVRAGLEARTDDVAMVDAGRGNEAWECPRSLISGDLKGKDDMEWMTWAWWLMGTGFPWTDAP